MSVNKGQEDVSEFCWELHGIVLVMGVYTTDPRVVKNAKKIKEISYEEMLELASSGTKVMQSRAVEFASKFNIPFEVRSSFNNNPGTIVKQEVASMEDVQESFASALGGLSWVDTEETSAAHLKDFDPTSSA